MTASLPLGLYDKLVRKRMVWIEPKFGEVKQWHHGGRCRLRGIEKVNIEALVNAAGQNLKQLLKGRPHRLSLRLPPPMIAALRADQATLTDNATRRHWLSDVLLPANTFCNTLSR